jgi:hypothetical protein
MRAALFAIVVLSLTLVSCRGDDDTAAPSTTRAVASTTTSTVPGPPPTVAAQPGPRAFTVRGVHLRAGESLDIALHPDSPMRLTAKTANLEVCPAAVNGGIDLTGGSWPGDVFDRCVPFVDGRATVPAPPLDTFHIAFGVRARGGGTTTIDVLDVDYAAVDQFCMVTFPPLAANATSPPVVVTPTRSTTVVAGTDSTAADVRVLQGGGRLPAYPPSTAQRGASYGPARLGMPVTATVIPRTALDRPTLLVEWS